MSVSGPLTQPAMPAGDASTPRVAKPESLRTRGQFGATLRTGRRERRALIAVAGRPNDLGRTRVGYAVGKRVGGAVVRNRVRRRLRELLRQHLGILAARSSAGAGWDLVVTAQPGAADASYAELGAEVESALRGLAEHRARHRGPRAAAAGPPGAPRAGGRG